MASIRLARYGARAALAASGLLAQADAGAAGCAQMQGGDLVLRSSEACLAQMRRDPAVRQQVARTIAAQVVTVADAGTAAGQAAPEQRPGRASAGLGHPLARLSMLNAQSRYLWSLGNPAPVYYGQTTP